LPTRIMPSLIGPVLVLVGVHINLFVLAYVVYCTMYTAVPPFVEYRFDEIYVT